MPTKLKSISYVIPTYNDGEYLKAAIESVLGVQGPVEEIIVVDDGSISGNANTTVDLLSASSDIPIHYYYKENGGPSSARNFGIQLAKSDWIGFLDSDDLMLPTSLVTKVDHLNKFYDEHIGGVYGSYTWSTTGMQQEFLFSSQPVRRSHIGIIGKVPGGAPAYIFRKDALLSVGGFDEKLTINEDFDLLLRLINHGYVLIGTNDPGFVRTLCETSLTRSNKINTLRGSRSFLKKAYREQLLGKREIFRRLVFNYISTGISQIFRLLA